MQCTSVRQFMPVFKRQIYSLVLNLLYLPYFISTTDITHYVDCLYSELELAQRSSSNRHVFIVYRKTQCSAIVISKTSAKQDYYFSSCLVGEQSQHQNCPIFTTVKFRNQYPVIKLNKSPKIILPTLDHQFHLSESTTLIGQKIRFGVFWHSLNQEATSGIQVYLV